MSNFVSLLETSKEVFKYILWVAFLTSYHVRPIEYLHRRYGYTTWSYQYHVLCFAKGTYARVENVLPRLES